MAQQPAVVIIARHGPRLDAADQQWHLTTPTPYDPPLTYGGWNQSKALGTRIASLLHAREEESAPVEPIKSPDGITVHDFAHQIPSSQAGRKRKRRHKVVIHTSPFLRCLQTSVAIAAGMAQYQSPSEKSTPSTSATSRSRTPASLRSGAVSPRLRAMDSPSLAPLPSILEPKDDFAHAIARRALYERKRHRKAKLRIDAFLGEWLNPPYFENITPPPPSAMMVATAKSELMHNETVDIFTPSVISTKSSQGSLWGGHQKKPSEDGALDDWAEVHDALKPQPRSRSNSATSMGSTDSGSGRRSPFRQEGARHLTSTIPKPETTVYVPPTPQYAVSGSETIPRGYVSHAKNACMNVDFQWDSSRPPQNWPDGGKYGEEWSAMHKRFRRGLNHLIHWYSQHDADDRAEDSLSLDQAERHEDEEQEDLVLILVTHGAGSNALIGALTGQPVLLDVGMASLTMAVRREDAPPVTTYASSTVPSADNTPQTSPNPEQVTSWPGPKRGHARRGSLDLGLASVYEMKLVSSSEHLRLGADPTKMPAVQRQTNAGISVPFRPPFTVTGADNKAHISAALGSIRRPSSSGAPALERIGSAPAVPQVHSLEERDTSPMPTFSGGLWTPPSGRTPILEAQKADKLKTFSQLDDSTRRISNGSEQSAKFTHSPPDSRPPSSLESKLETPPAAAGAVQPPPLAHAQAQAEADGHVPVHQHQTNAMAAALNGTLDGVSDARPQAPEHRGSISDLKAVGAKPPHGLSRGLSQKGLWGSRPSGEKVKRAFPLEPKRRWTVNQEDGVK